MASAGRCPGLRRRVGRAPVPKEQGQAPPGAHGEGFEIGRVLGLPRAMGDSAEAVFSRGSDRHELDLAIERGGETWAVEIRLTS